MNVATLLLVASLPGAAALSAQDPITESEPNNTAATADTAPLGDRVTGRDDAPEDIDYWVLNVRAGDTIFVDVDASELRSSMVPGVILYGSDGTTRLAYNEGWDGLDPYLVYVAQTSGPHYVAISGSLTGGHGASAFYTIAFRSTKCPVVAAEHEPNDSRATAAPLPLNSSVTALSCPLGDRDVYRFAVTKATRVVLEMKTPEQWRPVFGDAVDMDANLWVYTADDSLIAHGRMGMGLKDSMRVAFDAVPGESYFVTAWTYLGGFRFSYTLSTRETLAAGPGDPVKTVANGLGSPYDIAVSQTGDLYVPDPSRGRILRVTPAGQVQEFVTGLQATDLSFDPFGNLLAANGSVCCRPGDGVVYRIASNGTFAPLMHDLTEPFGLAAAPDGSIWVGDMAARTLHHYDASGHPLGTYDVSGLHGWGPSELAFAPSGDLYMSTEEAVYRFKDEQFHLVLREERVIRGIAFDAAGRIYVAHMGALRDDGYGGEGRIDRYDANGVALNLPFARTPVEPQRIAFGRNSDGSFNRHLYFTDGETIAEVKPGSIDIAGGGPGSAPCPAGTESEPNNTAETAAALDLGAARVGAICPIGDADFFVLNADAGSILELRGDGAREMSLELLGPTGTTRLAIDSGSIRRRPTMLVASGGKKFVAVRGASGSARTYTLKLQPPVSVGRASMEFLDPGGILSSDERDLLDGLGNQNGRFDIGDLRILLMRSGVSR